MKIYTKTGDKGETALFTGERLPKDSARVEAYGAIDEADSALGVARALAVVPEVKESIYEVQKLLWSLMADIASINCEPRITVEQVTHIEAMIDRFDVLLPPLSAFMIPGDTQSSAALDLARTITRRAERRLWQLSRQEKVSDQAIVFINRLSDLCFTWARVELNA